MVKIYFENNCYSMSDNSNTLCMSFMPGNLFLDLDFTRRQGQFLTPDKHNNCYVCFFNTWLMTKIQFNFPLTLEITSELLKDCQNNFTHFLAKFGSLQKIVWQAGTFSETPVITGRKSHALIWLRERWQVYIDMFVFV